MLPDHKPDRSQIQNPPTRWPRRRLLMGAAALVSILLALGLILKWRTPSQPPPPPAAPPPISTSLGKGRTLLDVLLAQGISADPARRIIQAVRPHLNLRRLKPEDVVEFHQDATGALSRIVYRQSPIDIIEVCRDGEDWTAASPAGRLKKGTRVVVTRADGIKLVVEPSGTGEGGSDRPRPRR